MDELRYCFSGQSHLNVLLQSYVSNSDLVLDKNKHVPAKEFVFFSFRKYTMDYYSM